MNSYVPYIRVSTRKQEESGLGLEAQQFAVKRFLESSRGTVAKEFVEVESGKNTDRPQLAKAISCCREGGHTLLVSRLDRLSRRASLIFNLRDAGINFVCADNPSANNLTVGISAVIAEDEVRRVSSRTRDALAAAKARGTRLGNPNPLAALEMARKAKEDQSRDFAERIKPVIEELKKAQVTSYRGIARCLNARGIKTITGKQFKAQTVKNLLNPTTLNEIHHNSTVFR